MAQAALASLVLEDCSGTRGLWRRLGDAPVFTNSQAWVRSKVDATLGTVVHRATAQLGLLLLVPALFTEIGEEDCNLSTG